MYSFCSYEELMLYRQLEKKVRMNLGGPPKHGFGEAHVVI